MTDAFADEDEPDLKLGGLSLWAESRERPDDDDYWDGNWLVIRARVEAPGSSVELRGPWLRTDEVASFLTEIEAMSKNLRGKSRSMSKPHPIILSSGTPSTSGSTNPTFLRSFAVAEKSS